MYALLATNDFVPEVWRIVQEYDVRKVIISQGQYRQYRNLQDLHEKAFLSMWDDAMLRLQGGFYLLSQPGSLKYDESVAMWVCFDYELQKKLVDPSYQCKGEDLDTLIEPPRWTRTVSGRKVSVADMCYYQSQGWEDKHRLNVRTGFDLQDPDIDAEVLREVYARVLNWLMYHEWHPYTYGESQDSLFYERGAEQYEQQQGHPAYLWDFEYVDCLNYNEARQQVAGTPPFQCLLLSRCKSVRDKARAFEGSLPYVFYTLVYGGRDRQVRKHLLSVGPKAGWEYVEKLREESRQEMDRMTLLIRDRSLWTGNLFLPGGLEKEGLYEAVTGPLSAACAQFLVPILNKFHGGLGEVLIECFSNPNRLMVVQMLYILLKLRFFLQSAKGLEEFERWVHSDRLDFEYVAGQYQEASLDLVKQDREMQARIARLFTALKKASKARKVEGEGEYLHYNRIRGVERRVKPVLSTASGATFQQEGPPRDIQQLKGVWQLERGTGQVQLAPTQSVQPVTAPPVVQLQPAQQQQQVVQQPQVRPVQQVQQGIVPATAPVSVPQTVSQVSPIASATGMQAMGAQQGLPAIPSQLQGLTTEQARQTKGKRKQAPVESEMVTETETGQPDFSLTVKEKLAFDIPLTDEEKKQYTRDIMSQFFQGEGTARQYEGVTTYVDVAAEFPPPPPTSQAPALVSAPIFATEQQLPAQSIVSGVQQPVQQVVVPVQQLFSQSPVASAAGMETSMVLDQEVESTLRPSQVVVPFTVDGGQGPLCQDGMKWYYSGTPYDDRNTTMMRDEYRMAQVQFNVGQQQLEMLESGREPFTHFSVRGVYDSELMREITPVRRWEEALEMGKGATKTTRRVPNYLDAIEQFERVGHLVTQLRDSEMQKGEISEQVYGREKFLEFAPFVTYDRFRGNAQTKKYNEVCSRSIPVLVAQKRVAKRELTPDVTMGRVLELLSDEAYQLAASNQYYVQLQTGGLCDKLFITTRGKKHEWDEVVSWHWLDLWECPGLFFDNLRYTAMLHYTTLDARLAEEDEHFTSIRDGKKRLLLQNQGKFLPDARISPVAGSQLIVSITLAGQTSLPRPGFKLHQGVSIQQSNRDFQKELVTQYPEGSTRPREAIPVFYVDGVIVKCERDQYHVRVTHDRQFDLLNTNDPCQVVPGFDRTNYDREIVAIRSIPQYKQDIQARGPVTLIEPATYQQPSFKGLPKGGTLTPYFTGNITVDPVEWDYKVPVGSAKSKQSLFVELKAINVKEVKEGREAEKSEEVLQMEAHLQWAANQQSGAPYTLTNEVHYIQLKGQCRELVQRLLGYLSTEQKEKQTVFSQGRKYEVDRWYCAPVELNESQLEAMLYAVHHKICLVQGPPGTGKTFVAALFVVLMLMIRRGSRISVSAVQNIAVDNFLDDLVAIRIQHGTPYSTIDSIPATEEQKQKGEIGLGERALGRLGREDYDCIPNAKLPVNFSEGRTFSWAPCSGNQWTIPDHTEVQVVNKASESSYQGRQEPQQQMTESTGMGIREQEEKKLWDQASSLISDDLFKGIIRVIARQRKNTAFARFLPDNEKQQYMREVQQFRQKEKAQKEGAGNFAGDWEEGQAESAAPVTRSKKGIRSELARHNQDKKDSAKLRKEDTERQERLKSFGDLKFLDPDRQKYQFAKAKWGVLRIGRSEGMSEYRRFESSSKCLAEELFNDPSATGGKMVVGKVNCQQAFAAYRYLSHHHALIGKEIQDARSAGQNVRGLEQYQRDCRSVMTDLREIYEKGIAQLESQFYQTASVIVGTTSSFGAKIADVQFDIAVIDEGSQATDAQAQIVLQRGVKKTMMVGDPSQLLPFTGQGDDTTRAVRSIPLFNRFGMMLWVEAENPDFKMNPFIFPIQMLKVNYRCPQDCYETSNQRLYGGMVTTSHAEKRPTPAGFPFSPKLMKDLEGPRTMGWLDTQGYQARRSGTSWFSEDEGVLVVKYIDYLGRIGRDRNGNVIGHAIDPSKIVVICMYAEQASYLTKVQSGHSVSMAYKDIRINTEFKIATVDSFQGRQSEFVIICTTRPGVPTGFVSDDRRLNVAATRCQRGMVVVGDFHNSKSSGFFVDLCKNIQKSGVVVRAIDFTVSYEARPETRRLHYQTIRWDSQQGTVIGATQASALASQQAARELEASASAEDRQILRKALPLLPWDQDTA